MSLRERLNEDSKIAQKKADATRLETLRFLISQVHNREIEKRSSGSSDILSDEEVIVVLQKEAKKRKEAIELYNKGGRKDLAEKEEKELVIINEYVPAMMSRGEVEIVVERIMKGGLKDFNGVMKEAMGQLKGRADGKTVSEVIKSRVG